jgi:hypothetical protein
MNDEQHPPAPPESANSELDQEDATSSGPNLTLIYSLIVLALVAAIGLALMIVLPFYHRH